MSAPSFPSHTLCAGPQCAALLGNIPAYRDTDHLTASAARALAPDMKRALSGTAPAPSR